MEGKSLITRMSLPRVLVFYVNLRQTKGISLAQNSCHKMALFGTELFGTFGQAPFSILTSVGKLNYIRTHQVKHRQVFLARLAISSKVSHIFLMMNFFVRFSSCRNSIEVLESGPKAAVLYCDCVDLFCQPRQYQPLT